MTVRPLYDAGSAAPLGGVNGANAVSTGAPLENEASVGAPATLWVSPPGLFFSVVHEISQAYPIELRASFMQLVSSVSDNDVAALGSLFGQTPAAPTPVRRRPVPARVASAVQTYAPPQPSSAPTTAPVSSLDALIGALRDLSRHNTSDFSSAANELNARFQAVVEDASGAESLELATLASQLNQAAQMLGTADRRPTDAPPSLATTFVSAIEAIVGLSPFSPASVDSEAPAKPAA